MSLLDKAKSFADKLTQSGEVAKLKIIAYSDVKFQSETGRYEVPFNPASLTLKLQIDRVEPKTIGQSAGTSNQVSIPPQDFSFEFIIDGTGAKGNTGGFAGIAVKKGPTVTEQIDKLLNLMYQYQGGQHQSNYIKIDYGDVKVKCVLKNMDINYNLFNSKGNPLRAKVNVTFRTTGDEVLQKIIGDAKSPDLTHIREIKQYDRFLNMSYKIYEDNFLYVQVARANNMNRIRENKTGDKIVFPPIKDEKK